MPRPYVLNERARHQAQTRERIRGAVVTLLEEVGPAGVTVAEVARRAEVQRLTVYNHFPDRERLLAAGAEHAVQRNPPPEPEAWRAIANPSVRLRAAIFQVHLWFGSEESRLSNAVGTEDPSLADWQRQARDALRDEEPGDRTARERRDAALALALSFTAFQQLVRGDGLAGAQAVEVLARAVEAAARP